MHPAVFLLVDRDMAGIFIVGFSFETTAAIVVAAVLANIAEGALAIRFLFLKVPRKVREFQEAGQDRSG